MDINSLRSLVTVVSFVAFIGILLWAWSARARSGFDQAALIPFLEDGEPGPPQAPTRTGP